MNKEQYGQWWHWGVIYQIYPKSFYDSGASGTGDLRGVIEKLDYLAGLGVDALWLTPVYASPQIDNGYDIADYYRIDPAYGTMADFEQLLAEAHRHGIRVIMDLVVNHTSTAHPWFQAAIRDPAGPYRDFYIWRDGRDGGPPNNWQSKFGGSAWQRDAVSGQYYLHLFAVEQADLNWENPGVREEVNNIVRFWAGKGVDGLRLDVINLISKDQAFPDDEQGDGRRFYTDGPRIHEFLHELNRTVFTPCNMMTVGEMSSTSLAHCQRYSSPDSEELSMVFNFHHLKVDYPGGNKWRLAPPDFVELKRLFGEWQRGLHRRGWNALFWCNHDQPRILSRFGDEGEYRERSAKMLAAVLHLMQGTPYIYQGEEIGMPNPGYDRIGQYADVESRNMHRILLEQGLGEEEVMAILAVRSRDNARSPMQWDDGEQAGFTRGTPWLAPGASKDRVNVAAALADPASVFYHYRRLILLRKRHPVIVRGDYRDLLPAHSRIWCYLRDDGEQRILVVANLGREPQAFEPPALAPWRRAELLVDNIGSAPAAPCALRLAPYQCQAWLLE
ncbi:alpha,alpha-phosphotrehalase [Zobellella endophytica]|uniref:Alpha,alpha-phosphotrehalase n=1 Tax=Zobellella endophytica TaxID=2116700 RepID=A0A2P7R7I6_9GAMM|nr:alpha,alpha-phosphotrehalase [Zobellella endophytica]PSJ46181.1 alpha,alpha-phosphotrehalase [Zobellella endophytica]